MTIASLITDLDERRLWLADGNPYETPYRELDYRELLAKSSPMRASVHEVHLH